MRRRVLFAILVLSFCVFGAWACPDGPRVIGPDGSVLPAGKEKEVTAEAATSAFSANAVVNAIVPALVGLLVLTTFSLFWRGRERRFKTALVVAALLLASLGLEAASVGFEVSAPPSQEATSGDTLRYIFILTNTSDLEDTFILGASSQHGWNTAILGGSTLSLGPGQTTEVTIELLVPRAVEEGTEDVLILLVVSQKSGKVLTASVTTKVTRNYMEKPHHVYGITPVDTAGVYASAAYPAYSANDQAVLTTVEDYGDAMLGSVLACFLKAPLLVTSTKDEDLQKVRALLVGEKGLGVRKVYVLGRLATLRWNWKERLGVQEVEVLGPSTPYDLSAYSQELAFHLFRELGAKGVVFAPVDYSSLFVAAQFASFNHMALVAVRKAVLADFYSAFRALTDNLVLIGLTSEVEKLDTEGLHFQNVIKARDPASLSYEVAQKIAAKIRTYGIPINAIVVTTRWDHGLGVIPFAYRSLWPVLMTEPGVIPEEVVSFLTEHNVEKLWLAGDETDFPDEVIQDYYRIQCSYFEKLRASYPKGDWPLKVSGDVETMLDLTVPELKARYTDKIVTVSIQHPKAGLQEYTGIRLLDLLRMAEAHIPCKVAVVAADGYQKTFLYEDIEANPDIILAIEPVKGQERLDLKVPGYPGWWWVKDVVKVIVISE